MAALILVVFEETINILIYKFFLSSIEDECARIRSSTRTASNARPLKGYSMNGYEGLPLMVLSN